MNIAVNTSDYNLVNEFIRICKEKGDNVTIAKVEDVLFKSIEEGNVDAYILTDSTYSEKAIAFIKKSNPYTPTVLIGDWSNNFTSSKADITVVYDGVIPASYFCKAVLSNIHSYVKSFAVLKKLTTKMADVIEFGNCKYDPTRRLLFVKDKEVKKLSAKEGGVLEILAANYGQVVKKDIIMEKVWRKSDYFVGRSLDVYVTHLRNTLKFAKIKMSIKNISNIGLILE